MTEKIQAGLSTFKTSVFDVILYSSVVRTCKLYISVNAIRERELPEEIYFAGYVQRHEKRKKINRTCSAFETKMSLQRGKLIETCTTERFRELEEEVIFL